MAALGMATGFIGKSAMMIWAASLPMLLPKANGFPPRQWARRRPANCLKAPYPDAERTMHTVLGASVTTAVDDLDAARLADTGLLFGEGYLWDSPSARTAFRLPPTMCGAGRQVLSRRSGVAAIAAPLALLSLRRFAVREADKCLLGK